MIKNRPLKRHEINPNRPLKKPIVTTEELKVFTPETLGNVLLFRRLGYNVVATNGFPQPPNPQFTDPD